RMAPRRNLSSPDKLQRKLNFPVGNLGRSELSERRIRRSVHVREGAEVRRRREVDVIENIEHLRAELQIERLGDFRNEVVLEYGEIHVKEGWPDNHVPSQVAANVGARCRGDARIAKCSIRGCLGYQCQAACVYV